MKCAPALMLAASLAWPWHSNAAFELKAAALATLYVLDYDLVVLAAATAFLTRHGSRCSFRDIEIGPLAMAWIVLLTRYRFLLRRAVLGGIVASDKQWIAQA